MHCALHICFLCVQINLSSRFCKSPKGHRCSSNQENATCLLFAVHIQFAVCIVSNMPAGGHSRKHLEGDVSLGASQAARGHSTNGMATTQQLERLHRVAIPQYAIMPNVRWLDILTAGSWRLNNKAAFYLAGSRLKNDNIAKAYYEAAAGNMCIFCNLSLRYMSSALCRCHFFRVVLRFKRWWSLSLSALIFILVRNIIIAFTSPSSLRQVTCALTVVMFAVGENK